MNITNYIEFTQLKPDATERDIIDFCHRAKENQFYSVCINSSYVALASQLLDDSNIKISSVVGFPFGAVATASKVFEAKNAIDHGAKEIDMVINSGLFKSRNYVSVLKDISNVKMAIGKIPLKVTLEISELNKNEIIKACEICLDANVDFIKTSTGFSKNGATFTAVKIIKKTIKNNAKVIAYDGIEDYETVLKYIESGCDRVAINSNIEIANEKHQLRNSKIYKQYIKTMQKDNLPNTNNITEKISNL